MKPSHKYQSIVEQPEFFNDTAQNHAIILLDDLYDRLQQQMSVETGRWDKLFANNRPRTSITGLYFWGGVGRGKTFLMDIFYQSLPNADKQRSHFHDFMNQIHAALKGQPSLENPLHKVARDLARDISILCLDEFVITDIGDAMIMAGLLEALLGAGVVLVATSNSAPQNLYHDGLQRVRFLPAIDLVCQHCDVVNIDGGADYRLKGLQQTDLYTVPHSQAVNEAILRYLHEHVTPAQAYRDNLCINDRQLSFQICAEDTIWFSFTELCKTTRSQNDYLELARLFNTLILTDIETMSSMQDDIARRFVLLIDVLYDHRVKLICSAAAKAENLYNGKRLAFEFERTSSRLIEMHSQQYLTQAHTQQ
ncbi:MAG: cell division protein ZapE [Gammaproteobacteria bacterium]|nr:cell division protein ZapE [Gammaproteobacteria bacterium]